jgi:predicted dehydrogenase
MAEPVKVGLIGIGGMGRTHFDCYQNNPSAQIVAICDIDEKKLAGDWSGTALNIDTGSAGEVDLSRIAKYSDYHELINDPNVELVDICLPTKLHAPASIASLNAGKNTFCEKPMAFTADECAQMEEAVEKSGKQLMIGHCLRYWPAYVEAKKIIDSGKYGKVLYARFFRTGGTPWWSWNNWLATGSESGGPTLDMHIHDADTALWWFGKPDEIQADGFMLNGAPGLVDATWRYNNGPVVQLHGQWDNNGGDFDFGFKVVLESATLLHHPTGVVSTLKIVKGGKDGDESEDIELPDDSAYQLEINDFVDCVQNNRKMERVTPQASKVAVEVCREEIRQIEAKNQN